MGGDPFGGDPTTSDGMSALQKPVEEEEKTNTAGNILDPPDVKVSEPKGGMKDEFTIKPPKPETQPLPPNDMRKPYGEAYIGKLLKQIANENTLTTKEKMAMIKAFERIPLPPSATHTSTDLYVGQGVDDNGVPEITDPNIRSEYGWIA